MDWLKIIIDAALFAGAYFLICMITGREFSVKETAVKNLEDELKEKRIKLKSDGENLVLLDQQELFQIKEKLGSMKDRLQIQLENRKTQDTEVVRIYEQYTNLVSTHTAEENKRNKEINEINSNYAIIVQNTNKAFTIADNLSSSAKNAFDLSGDVQEEIKIVTAALQDIAEKSSALYDQSKKISKIIEIINEISAKTHILSINASIVSARAGKEGRTFDVVSREIRKLATETDKSLKQIEDEINKIQEIIKYLVKGINDANVQTMKERDMLTAVIGALQGVTLGVEVLRAVSNVVNTKTVQQKAMMETIFVNYQKILKDINTLSVTGKNPSEGGNLAAEIDYLKSIINSFQ